MKIPPPVTATVAPLGPNARAMLEDVHSHCVVCGYPMVRGLKHECGLRDGRPAYTRVELDKWASGLISPSPLSQRILGVVRNAVQMRRQSCYGVTMTDEQAEEMARGVATSLICSFEITDGE